MGSQRVGRDWSDLACMNNILLCVCTTFSLSIPPSMDIWAASTSWLLCPVLKWAWVSCWYLFWDSDSVLLDKYPEVGLLDCLEVPLISLIFGNLCAIFHSHRQCARVPISPHPCQRFVVSFFDNSHPDRCEVISHCAFDLHFLDD